jgi:hypothetical protein
MNELENRAKYIRKGKDAKLESLNNKLMNQKKMS